MHANFVGGAAYPEPISKVVCVGRNYAAHAQELNNPLPQSPLLFIKPNSAVVKLADQITIPVSSGEVHYETELALLIGSTLCRATREQAKQAIAGLGIGLDLTLRTLQSELKKQGHPWEKSKAFDGSCPLSAFIDYQQQALDQLVYSLSVNGVLRQCGNSSNMLTPIIQLLLEISQYFTLIPGDIVLTGTPEGVGVLEPGDRLEVSGFGRLFASCLVEPLAGKPITVEPLIGEPITVEPLAGEAPIANPQK